jgi:hypothetical protein
MLRYFLGDEAGLTFFTCRTELFKEIIRHATVFYAVAPRFYVLSASAFLAVFLLALLIIKRRRAALEAKTRNSHRRPHLAASDAAAVNPSCECETTPAAAPPPPVHMPDLSLTVLDGSQGERVYNIMFDQRIIIGRDPSCCNPAIHADNEIALVHCELKKYDGDVIVKNLDPKNVTILNNVPVSTDSVLEDGDILILGKTRLMVSIKKGYGGGYR